MMDMEDLSDDELMEELLARQGGVTEAAAEARLKVAIEAAGGDEQRALQELEQLRVELVDKALGLLTTPSVTEPDPTLAQQAAVIWAHDILLERLEPDGDAD